MAKNKSEEEARAASHKTQKSHGKSHVVNKRTMSDIHECSSGSVVNDTSGATTPSTVHSHHTATKVGFRSEAKTKIITPNPSSYYLIQNWDSDSSDSSGTRKVSFGKLKKRRALLPKIQHMNQLTKEAESCSSNTSSSTTSSSTSATVSSTSQSSQKIQTTGQSTVMPPIKPAMKKLKKPNLPPIPVSPNLPPVSPSASRVSPLPPGPPAGVQVRQKPPRVDSSTMAFSGTSSPSPPSSLPSLPSISRRVRNSSSTLSVLTDDSIDSVDSSMYTEKKSRRRIREEMAYSYLAFERQKERTLPHIQGEAPRQNSLPLRSSATSGAPLPRLAGKSYSQSETVKQNHTSTDSFLPAAHTPLPKICDEEQDNEGTSKLPLILNNSSREYPGASDRENDGREISGAEVDESDSLTRLKNFLEHRQTPQGSHSSVYSPFTSRHKIR